MPRRLLTARLLRLALGAALVLGLASAPALPCQGPDPSAAGATPAPGALLWQRPVVIGASASGGFGLRGEAGCSLSLANFVDAVLPGGHTPALDAAEPMFFLDPEAVGRRAVDQALAADPSVVFGLDFLFWYAYGDLAGGEEERLSLFEVGLQQLERLSCPLVVGDLPDMRRATEAKVVFKMLSASQVPQPATLEQLNQRLGVWAAGRQQVAIVPLARFLARLEQGQPIDLCGNHWGQADLPRLLQRDQLHTTLEGTAALTVLAFDALLGKQRELDPKLLVLDAASLRQSVYDSCAEERSKAADKRRTDGKPVQGG